MRNWPALTSIIGHGDNCYSGVVAGLPSWSPAPRTAFLLKLIHAWRTFECVASVGWVLYWCILFKPQMKKHLGYFLFKASKRVISKCLYNQSICLLSSNSLSFFPSGTRCCILVVPKPGWSSEFSRVVKKIPISMTSTSEILLRVILAWILKSRKII